MQYKYGKQEDITRLEEACKIGGVHLSTKCLKEFWWESMMEKSVTLIFLS